MSQPKIQKSRIKRLSGFGMTQEACGYLYRPTNIQEIKEVFQLAQESNRQIVLRGSGRSYGDASIGNEVLVLDISRFDQIHSFNKSTGEIDCQSGVTIEKLWKIGIEDGFWPPVVSGTMFPTLAGALAMNIHGKNCFKAGTLGEHISEIDVLFPSGDIRKLTPDNDHFYQIISSAGLLGVITRVKLQMKKVKSGDLRVLPLSIPNWDAQFQAFEQLQNDADYMVSWIDGFAKGDSAGRGLFHAAWHQQEEAKTPASFSLDHQTLPDTILGFIPKSMVWRFLKPLNNRWGMKWLNRAKHISSKWLGDGKPFQESLVAFSFLLDFVPNWRNAYGKGGFIQYQSFVPKDKAKEVFSMQINLQQTSKLESFLCVLKRHRPDSFLFSHGIDGYSLALDFKVTKKNKEKLWNLAHQMNEIVIQAGGKFYLAKDSTLRPNDFQKALGEAKLKTFHKLKAELDPDHILTSNLEKRLNLTGDTE